MLEVESSGHCGRMTTTTPEVAETGAYSCAAIGMILDLEMLKILR